MTYIRMGIRMGAVAALSGMMALPALAQNPPAGPPPQGAQPNQPREVLEQRLRQRTGEMVKRRLGLTDDQMAKLQATNKSFETQRTDLMKRERDTRMKLRGQLLSGDSANQNRVSQLLDQAIQIQRQRIDLLQSEQRELAKFMTPVQRAKYIGFQNEMRQRAQTLRAQMQRQRMGPMQGPMGGRMRPMPGAMGGMQGPPMQGPMQPPPPGPKK